MGRFTAIPQDTFQAMQLEAGILLYDFDLETETYRNEDLICATTGGITASCVPTFSDLGEDVDNCPVNMMELKHLDGWDCRLGFTSLGTDPKGIRLALGAADIDGADKTKIVPRRTLSQGDFSSVWWVGDRADGGFVAVYMRNALSSSGFSLQTSKAGKGQTSVELTGHVSIDAQDVVPMTFYSRGPLEQKSTVAEVPAKDHIMLGKPVSDLVSEDTVILEDGTVKGALHYITGFTAFSSKTEEQTGNYFPLTLAGSGTTMTLKKNGAVIPDKEDLPFDKEIIFRVPDKSVVFSVDVDGKEAISLNFTKATLEEVGV